MPGISLKEYDITVADVRHNPSPAELYEDAIRSDKARVASQGALVAFSGDKTGRSPKDKRVVQHPDSQDDVWWGAVNIPLERPSFLINRERARDYLNTRPRIYVFDGFAGWDPQHRLKVRVICSRPYHALFMHVMLIRPTKDELANFGTPDFVITNAGEFPANRLTSGMTSKTSIDLSFEDKELVILGSEYAGEMKKGVFTIMNYLMPKAGILSMHCSATTSHDGKTSILFGLSGTGKTTLSADPKRLLIGDDEHCWSDAGIFNIEGGCYAKTIDLSAESEPDIYNALHYGSVLEKRGVARRQLRGLPRRQHHPKYSRGVPDRVHQKRQDSVHGRSPEGRDLPDVRCVRGLPARRQADTATGDVSLHQRLHGQNCGD